MCGVNFSIFKFIFLLESDGDTPLNIIYDITYRLRESSSMSVKGATGKSHGILS